MSDIDFDTAQFDEQAAAPCVVCKNELSGAYWEVNGQLVCERCYRANEAEFQGGADATLYARGFALGLGAAFLGAVGWLLILVFSGYQLGIVAIAVGWLVGKAVSVGTKRKGGIAGQVMAVGLTYLAIVSQYIWIQMLQSEQGLHVVAAIGHALIAPFAEGFGNILGIVILGFGLYQAWQNSASMSFSVRGPFRIQSRVREDADVVG